MESLLELLARMPLFARLGPGDCEHLADQALCRSYRPGEPVVHSGDVWPYLFVVQKGALSALKESSEGRSLIVTNLEPGDLFWGQAFFRQEAPMLVRLEAHQASRLCLWPREVILPVLLRNGPALWELCVLMMARMEWASEILEEFAFLPVAGRLARVLLDHFARAGGGRLERSLTLDELAAWAGTTREMACRTLYRFADQGLLEITRTELRLTDGQGLARVADKE